METSPAPTPVGHNAWHTLDVPDLGAWEPSLGVSVILPFYRAQAALELTLAALAEQSYPAELLEVIVADDGSEPPAQVPAGLDELVRVAWQEDDGFGLARVRNLGAREATGDILVFLDCDMIPERHAIEAHARWHHAVPDAVSIGTRRHVEVDGISPADVGAAVAGGGLAELFAGRPVQVPEWIEAHYVRTHDLTSTDDDLFRVASGGNLGIRRDFYWEAGGNDESFTQWGAEDTEFGFRLFTLGGLLVPEREALCWHQGHGHEPTEAERRSLDEQRAKIAHLIAHRSFREGGGRSYTVPRLVVDIEVDTGTDRDVVARVVGSVLASSLHDLVVTLRVPDEHPDAVWLERQLGPDPRVALGERPEDGRLRFAPNVLVLPPDVPLGPTTAADVLTTLEDPAEPVGVLRLTVPGHAPAERSVVAYRRRALARAARSGATDPLAAAERSFGVRWIPGADVGLGEAVAATPRSAPTPGTVPTDDLREVWDLLGSLEPAERTQLVRVAKVTLTRVPRRWLRFAVRAASRVLAVARRLR